MKKIIFNILLISAGVLQAQSTSDGLTFLKTGNNARDIALSDFGVTSSTGYSAIFYNPANIKSKSNWISISHTSFLTDANSNYFNAGFTVFDIPFAVGFNSTSISDFEFRELPGEAISKFNVHYFYGSIGSSYEINQNISAGISIKYIYENLFSDEAEGYGIDFGIQVENFYKNLKVGGAVKNYGNMSKLRRVSTELPTEISLGASYEFDLQSLESVAEISTGIREFVNVEDLHFHSGVEIIYKEFVAIRLGFVSGVESKSISYGTGFKWGKFNFDYAFVPMDYNLGDSHFITLGYSFQ